MKNSWAWVSNWHDAIRQVLVPSRGTMITTSQWEDLIREVPGIGSKANWIHPSDHCLNMNNKGACDCAETNRALVRQISRGHYLVL